MEGKEGTRRMYVKREEGKEGTRRVQVKMGRKELEECK